MLDGKLSLGNYNTQIGETYAMLKARTTRYAESQYVLRTDQLWLPCLLTELSNKATYPQTSTALSINILVFYFLSPGATFQYHFLF